MAAEQRICSGCGVLFLATNHGRVGRLPKWCEGCRAGSVGRCECGTHFVRDKSGQARCKKCRASTLAPGLTGVCEACGKPFARARRSTGTDAGRACSRECGWILQRMDGARRRAAREEKTPPFSMVTFPECAVCGERFVVRGRRRRKHCGPECRAEAGRRRAFEIAREQSPINWSATYRCAVCAAEFAPGRNAKSVECCSAACFRTKHNRKHKRLHGNHRRRARTLGRRYEPIDKRKVFERDNWTCMLCGKKCRKTLPRGAHWHPALATLDHIIPLSWPDGHHLWSNVQCACWDCNSKKSANEARGQLSLFARVA